MDRAGTEIAPFLLAYDVYPHGTFDILKLSSREFARARRSLAVVCLVAIASLWWFLAGTSSPRILGFLVLGSYILAWLAYFAAGRERISRKIGQWCLTTTSLSLLLASLEVPAVLGLVDYRLVLALPESALYTRIKPWDNPRNGLDRELLHIHRPGERFVGQAAGDLVHWLGVPSLRRYPVDVRYDARGFRNDRDLDRAAVVVIGDSFVEAGLVSQPALLSTRLSRLLQVEVSNLGQSGYGPQQELIVLRRYGLPLRPEVIVWLFFEGNDLLDIPRYRRMRQDWDAKMKELSSFKLRSFTRNLSLVLAGLGAAKPLNNASDAHRRSCRFPKGRSEEERTLHFAYAGSPLSPEELESLQEVERVLLEADRTARSGGARFLLVYVPTKYRVYRELCEFPAGSEVARWELSDLPDRVKSWCGRSGVFCLDLIPALKAAAKDGMLVYFHDDGHWNSKGHEVAAEAIAGVVRAYGWLGSNGRAHE